jgi:hypothetical protein
MDYHKIMDRAFCLAGFLFFFFTMNCSQVDPGGVAPPTPGEKQLSQPELPRVVVDTTMPVQTGKTHQVTACNQLQDAIDEASLGDTIAIDANLACQGSFQLPEKSSGSGWIIIQSSALANLPSEGTRIQPTLHARYMPKILSNSNNAPAISTRVRANHYRLIGLELGAMPGITMQNSILLLDSRAFTVNEYPNNIVVDRCYIHGNPSGTYRRGIGIGGSHIAILDSHISEFHEEGADSQAIAGWNFPGPLKIVNNFVEGAGENIIFGGSAPVVTGVVPSDIEIRRNHIYKPLRWWPRSPEYAGVRWSIKNSFEVKSGQRILFEGNVVENNWQAAQVGFMVVLTPAYQNSSVPQAVVQDITIRYNRFLHSASWINSNYTSPGDDSSGPGSPPDVVCTPGQIPVGCLRARRWNIHDNLAEDISGAKWGGDGRVLQILGPQDDIVFEHNTIFADGALLVLGSPGPARHPTRFSQRFIYRNNIVAQGRQSIFGNGTAPGWPTLEFHVPGYIFRGNVIVGNAMTPYPGKNISVGDWTKVKFVDLEGGNYRLAPGSKYRKAGTDGKDIGADIDALEKATEGVVVNVKPPAQ